GFERPRVDVFVGEVETVAAVGPGDRFGGGLGTGTGDEDLQGFGRMSRLRVGPDRCDEPGPRQPSRTGIAEDAQQRPDALAVDLGAVPGDVIDESEPRVHRPSLSCSALQGAERASSSSAITRVASSRIGGGIQSEHRRACTIGSMSFLPAELPHTAARGANFAQAAAKLATQRLRERMRESRLSDDFHPQDDDEFTAAVHFAGDLSSVYQLEQWLWPFEQLEAHL